MDCGTCTICRVRSTNRFTEVLTILFENNSYVIGIGDDDVVADSIPASSTETKSDRTVHHDWFDCYETAIGFMNTKSKELRDAGYSNGLAFLAKYEMVT